MDVWRVSFCAAGGLVLQGLFSCGGGVEPDDYHLGDVEDPGSSLLEQEDDRAFGLQLRISMLIEDPFTPDSYAHLQVWKWFVVDWYRDGTEIAWTEELCSIESTEVFNTTTAYPQSFLDAVPAPPRSGTLSEAVTGATFSTPAMVDVIGADLADPAHDPLPTDPEDPTVEDSDGDGNPGATVVVTHSALGAGDLYIAQRGTFTYEGVVLNGDRIEGYIAYDPDQTVLGAGTWWLEQSSEPLPDEELKHSYFVFQAIGEGVDCESLLASRDEVFGPRDEG